MTEPIDPKDIFSPTREEINIASRMIKTCMDDKGRRSLDEERVFMENLLVQRLNFLLVVFSIFVAAGFAAKTNLLSVIVFFAGFLICWLMAKIVYRAHVKHHFIMRLFYNLPESEDKGELPHAIKFINDAMKKDERKEKTKGSVSKWVGDRIPTVCWGFLLLCAIGSTLAFIAPAQLEQFLDNFKVVTEDAELTLTYIDSTGKITESKGLISYKVQGATIELTIIDSNGKTCIMVLPVDRFLSIRY